MCIKSSFAVFGFIALSATSWAAPDLNESYEGLKAAVEKKDAAQVKTLAAETSKEAKEVAKEAQPADAAQMEGWKGRQEFAKQANDYSEYALAAVALQVPASTIELTDALVAQNPKSKHLDTVAAYYLATLGKQGAGKANAAAQKILAGNPDQEDALSLLAGGNPQYANRLVQVMRAKAKPEGMSDADWEKKKSTAIAYGTYLGAIGPCNRSAWAECDRSMRAAEPTLKGSSYAGNMYYSLGVANFQLGTLTSDRSKMQEGLNFTKQAAAIPGQMQAQARNNVDAMTKQMAAPRR